MKYENTDTSTPWPPSPAGEGGISGSGSTPVPSPERLGLSGLSIIFNGGFHKGHSPFGGGMGVSPTLLIIPPKNGGQGVERAIFGRIDFYLKEYAQA